MNLRPIDLRKINGRAANVYEAIAIAGKRARQINDENHLEYNTQVNSIIGAVDDDLDERVNPEMIKISMQFETKPKPHVQGMDELINGDLDYEYKDLK